jgi:hypothetical protein
MITTQDVETTLNRINQQPGVLGIIISQNDSKNLRLLSQTPESPVAQFKEKYALHCSALAVEARTTVRDLDPTVYNCF